MKPHNKIIESGTLDCGGFNYVSSSDYFTYGHFKLQQFYVLPTQCIYVFCVDLRTNSDYFAVQH